MSKVLPSAIEETLADAKKLIQEIERDFPEPIRKTSATRAVGYWTGPDHVKKHVDRDWNGLIRWAVIGYLKAGGVVSRVWRGYANCRVSGCRHHLNGSTCLTDGEWSWPEGYAHYLVDHGVKPPPEFITHVLTKIGLSGHCVKTGKKCRYSDDVQDSSHCLDCGEELR